MALTDTLSRDAHGIAAYALHALKGGYHQSTLTGNVVLSDNYPVIVGFDPGGSARDVTLDGSAATDAAIDGLMRLVLNRADAAEDLTVKDQAGSTIGTVSQNELGIFYHDATDGWALVCLFTIALS